ncbi:MAG: hbpA [Paucimonas sp.]|nr:hbpA [Paucimonas sp.]
MRIFIACLLRTVEAIPLSFAKAARNRLSLLTAVFAFLISLTSHAQTSPADPAKVIRVAFEAPDDGFDMVRTANAYSGWVSEAIFERLLTYDYLARPAKLVPGTAIAMPEVAEGGKVFTFRLKKGIYFSPDPAFKGTRRELTSHDYVYTIKRLLDPKNRSPAANFIEGKIVGLDALASKAKKSGHFDYDQPIDGLQALDRYTLRIRLNAPDYNFLYVMAYGAFGAVAREVIDAYGAHDAYGAQSGLHPIGTGPYMLHQYVPRSRIVLTANPHYRGFVWDFQSSGDAWDEKLIQDMRGKKMPQIGRVEISIIEEEQSRWLAFLDKQIDLDKLPQTAAPKVLENGKLKPEYASQGISLYRYPDVEITYTLFNMRDPVLGGYEKEKIALRRAIAMSYNVQDEINLIRMGQATEAEMIVPAGIGGHDPAYRSSISYDPALANKLLDRFGYRKGSDGYRRLPDGSPLVVNYRSETSAVSKMHAELWKRSLERIGLRFEASTSNFADNVKAATACTLAMWGSAWVADFPDGENFLQLLYGPNAGRGNHSCYQSAAYDDPMLDANWQYLDVEKQ